MPTFNCKIGTPDGRVLEKEFESSSPEILRESLVEQGFSVFQIRKRVFSGLFGKTGAAGSLSGRRFLSLNQELIVLIRSGLPILQVLDAITERMEAGGLLVVLREIREDIKGGGSLSEAFAKYPRFFPPLFIASLQAGERTGDLPITIARYIAYQKRVEALKAKVRSASFYPVLLSVAAIVVLFFLMLWVIPNFIQIFSDAKVQLPLITRILVGATEILTASVPFLLPLLVFGIVSAKLFIRTEKGALVLDRIILKLPFFGPMLLEYALSSFCRTLGTTLSSGMPLVQAMRMSRGTLNNRILEGRIRQSIRQVEEGQPFSGSLSDTGIFPGIALRMIAAGEAGGSLGEMLGEVADYYEGEVTQKLDKLTTLIEPLLMLGIGLLIGGIVVAMYIPIFQLAGTVR